jgi:hypothetical protein
MSTEGTSAANKLKLLKHQRWVGGCRFWRRDLRDLYTIAFLTKPNKLLSESPLARSSFYRLSARTCSE